MAPRDPAKRRSAEADPEAVVRQARDKVAAARVWLMKHKPFFGVLARALRLEPTPRVASFRLLPDDRLRLNPAATLDLRFPALCARLAHLSLHAALGAFGRRRGREARRWNLAHDLAIAPLLEAADLACGPPASRHEGLADLPPGASAEAFYDALGPSAAPEPLWRDLCDVDSEPPTADDEEGQHGEAQHGEAQHGAALPGDVRSPLPFEGTRGEALDASNVDTRGRELQWKMRLGAAYEEELASGGKTFGEMPAWIDDLVRATIEPPADWSVILQQAVSTLRRSERTYLRPSRRMSAVADFEARRGGGPWPSTVTMPGRRVEAAGQLVVVVDTSASIPEGTLARFFGAVVAVATAEGIDEVRLLQADAAVTRDELRFAADLLFEAIPVTGRGGTSFAPALEQLAEESRRAATAFTVVYLTDLDGRFPDASSVEPLDVVWVTPHPRADDAPFGRVVVMTPDAAAPRES